MKNANKTIWAFLLTVIIITSTSCSRPENNTSVLTTTSPVATSVTHTVTPTETPVITSAEVTGIPTGVPASVTPSATKTPIAEPTATPEPTLISYDTDEYNSFMDKYGDLFASPAPTESPATPELSRDDIVAVDLSRLGFKSAYHFSNEIVTGSTFDDREYKETLIDCSFPYEGKFGIVAKTTNENLYIKAYSNLDYKPDIVSSILTNGKVSYEATVSYDNYAVINLKEKNGAYAMQVIFETKIGNIRNQFGIYVDSGVAYTCELSTSNATSLSERKAKTKTFMNDLDISPTNQTDLSVIKYPVCDDRGRCDTMRWAELSKDIITDKNWSDGYKVTLIHEWIMNNIAYDEYRADVLDIPRDFYYDDHNGKYSVWNTRAGVCFDITHIFLIMCRYNGIPCTTVECNSPNHMWNIVYINDTWYEIDLTADLYRLVETEDTADISTISATYYSNEPQHHPLESIGDCVWTLDAMFSDGHNYSWYYKR